MRNMKSWIIRHSNNSLPCMCTLLIRYVYIFYLLDTLVTAEINQHYVGKASPFQYSVLSYLKKTKTFIYNILKRYHVHMYDVFLILCGLRSFQIHIIISRFVESRVENTDFAVSLVMQSAQSITAFSILIMAQRWRNNRDILRQIRA